MEFLETAVFTRCITSLLTDDQYRLLQLYLAIHPESGDLIKGSGGLRKVRWGTTGSGKRGGIRVIYYFLNPKNRILLLFAYPKNKQENLTEEQLSTLKKLMRSIR